MNMLVPQSELLSWEINLRIDRINCTARRREGATLWKVGGVETWFVEKQIAASAEGRESWSQREREIGEECKGD